MTNPDFCYVIFHLHSVPWNFNPFFIQKLWSDFGNLS